jgi:protein-S-isoprenylcysteine O-methyltransferase Ste14
MTPEKVFRIASLVLLGGLVVMRGYFSLRVRQAGERLLPDREAVEREGKGAFLLRVVSFFVLIGILVSYASDLPWVVVLSFPLPVFLRWTGFAIGVAAVLLWTWTQAALRTAWSPQQERMMIDRFGEEYRSMCAGPADSSRNGREAAC